MLKGKFRVPTYYKYFKCKCGECRNCCCSGWNITLTLNDYTKLMNLECSDKLKDSIKNGISMFSRATQERFAKIDMNYYGECKLRLENGWCGLQCEVGEEHIPSVCRYYPRGIRKYPYLASSISNSCEWVIEYLSLDENKMQFENLDLEFDIDKDENIKIYPDDFEEIQSKIFSLFESNDSMKEVFEKLSSLLNVKNDLSNEFILNVLNDLYSTYKHSYSIGSYIDQNKLSIDFVSNLLNTDHEKIAIIKKILINHIYFSLYPYVRSDLNMEYSYYGLYFIYMFYNSLLELNCDSNFIDLSANFFRTAEHANMYDMIYDKIKKYK